MALNLIVVANLGVIHLHLETELVPLRRFQVEIIVIEGCIFWVIRDKHGLFFKFVCPKWCIAIIIWL